MAYTPPPGAATNFDFALSYGGGTGANALVLSGGRIRTASVSSTVLATRFAQLIGNGSSLTFTVTHNLNTTALVVQVFDVSYAIIAGTNRLVDADISIIDVNNISVAFYQAPSVNQYEVVVFG